MPTNIISVATYTLNEATLLQLDKDSLYRLLEHKTNLYKAAMNIGMPENSYTKQLKTEIKAIQFEIKRRE